MKHILIFIYFLLILFIQFNQQQAAPVDLSSSDDMQYDPLSWYSALDELENRQYHHPTDHFYKRFIHELLLPERQRRFGNTKYGRSLKDE